MNRVRKKNVLLIILVFLTAVSIAGLYFLWPVIRSATSVKQLEDGLYSMTYRGDYGLDEFLTQGGGSSDMAVADFVIGHLFYGLVNLDLRNGPFGCSTLSVTGPEGTQLFGRNFDWGACATLIVRTQPQNGYSSISTVNMDFLSLEGSLPEAASVRLMSAAAPYAPMDGMNEKGLCVAVLMIEDRPGFQQESGKPDLTTTTAVRLLLDKAADVDEALTLLEQYDLHASAGMMVHFAIADAAGRSVAVEYVDNKMSVVETPIVTNFYLTPGEKYGVGTEESHRRYEILTDTLAGRPSMTMEDVRDAMNSVSKHNFDSVFASTEWSTVFDQTSGEARYYLIIKELLLLGLSSVAGHHHWELIPIPLFGRFQHLHQGIVDAFIHFLPASYLQQIDLVVFGDSIFIVHQHQIPIGVAGRWLCVFSQQVSQRVVLRLGRSRSGCAPYRRFFIGRFFTKRQKDIGANGYHQQGRHNISPGKPLTAALLTAARVVVTDLHHFFFHHKKLLSNVEQKCPCQHLFYWTEALETLI